MVHQCLVGGQSCLPPAGPAAAAEVQRGSAHSSAHKAAPGLPTSSASAHTLAHCCCSQEDGFGIGVASANRNRDKIIRVLGRRISSDVFDQQFFDSQVRDG